MSFPSLNSISHLNSFELQMKSLKQEFLDSLTSLESLNGASKERTTFLQRMIDNKVNVPVSEWVAEKETASTETKSLKDPGLVETFNYVSKGDWKVVYAPHMTTIAGLFGGKFDVEYKLHSSYKMESHAKYDFPVVGKGFLSLSGTYGSVDENVCRVDFDKAWIKPFDSSIVDGNEEPYQSLDKVPDGPVKEVINAVGKALFIEQFSVFPISYLDDNLIVFDFPLLGTRICALKLRRLLV